MTAAGEPEPDPKAASPGAVGEPTPDREALRRRLYRPDAEPADLAAFLAIGHRADPERRVPAPGEAPPHRPADEQSVPHRRSRRAWPPVLAVASIAVAALVVIPVVGTAAWRAVPNSSPTPRSTATPLPTDPVGGQRRAEFVRALVEQRLAGLSSWLMSEQWPVLETSGTGDRTVVLPIADTAADSVAGRLTVTLVLASDGIGGWSPARLVIHDDRTIHLATEERRSGTLLAGIPASATTRYAAGERPERVIVQAPRHVRWGLAAVFMPDNPSSG